MEMDSVKIMLAFVLLSHSMIVNGAPVGKCSLSLCYLPIDCDKSPPANGHCCPKCKEGKVANINKEAVDSSGQFCDYKVGDKIKVNIPDGKSKKIDCITCTCSSRRRACLYQDGACGKSCDFEVGDRIMVNIPDGESTKIDCNTCMCSDGVLACTKLACVKA